MAFLVLLQRLTPAERAVLLLHDVFDFTHGEIASLVHRSEAACRQLLRRARRSITADRKLLVASREDHARLVGDFMAALASGDVHRLLDILADGAVLVADGGPDGVRYGRVRNLPRPLSGAVKIAAFLMAVGSQQPGDVRHRVCQLNGAPAIVTLRDDRPIAAILFSVADGKIHRIFIHADPARLRHVCCVS